jgi:hypothetical protein
MLAIPTSEGRHRSRGALAPILAGRHCSTASGSPTCAVGGSGWAVGVERNVDSMAT